MSHNGVRAGAQPGIGGASRLRPLAWAEASAARALDVRDGEGALVGLLFGVMLAISAGGCVGGNAVDALFFARFGVRYLPYMYVTLGIVTAVTAMSFTAALGRFSRRRLYVVVPVSLALVLVAERALLGFGPRWLYPVMWLGMMLTGSLQSLVTWGLAALVCDTRQAKRLFPLFAAGGVLGAVFGGLGTQPLARWLHSENLLLVWAAALLAATLMAEPLLRGRGAGGRRPAGRGSAVGDVLEGYRSVRRSPLLRWTAASSVTLAVLYFLLSFPFAKAVAAQFPRTDDLAGFLGIFSGVSTGVAFLVSLLLANRLFARFGILNTVLVFAAMYLVGFALLSIQGGFGALVAFRFVQMAWFFGVASTAYHASFNVVHPEQRDQARAFMEGVLGQVGIVLAGLVLVFGDRLLRPQQLYLLGLGVAVAAVFFVLRERRSYSRALVLALRDGQPHVFEPERTPFAGFQHDRDALASVLSGVSDSDAAVRRLAIGLLPLFSAPEVQAALVSGLEDPDPEVRLEACAAVRHAVPFPEAAVPVLHELLQDGDPAVRCRAAHALAAGVGDPSALHLLCHVAADECSSGRAAALEALGELEHRPAARLLVQALRDPRPSVRRSAAAALPWVDAAGAVEPLVGALADPEWTVREAVAEALSGCGPDALPALLQALDSPALEPGALAALERRSERLEPEIRRYAGSRVGSAVEYQALSVCAEGCEDGEGRPLPGTAKLLADSLAAKARLHAVNGLRAVGILHDPRAVEVAIEGLGSSDREQRANALEMLDAVGEAQLVRPLLQLWEDERRPAPAQNQRWLLRAAADPDPWVRQCAALVAAGSEEPEVRAALERLARDDEDEEVRGTAAAALEGVATMKTRPTLSEMERVLLLRRVPLFASLEPVELKEVAAITVERLHRPGETIARQGEQGDQLYVVLSGEVAVLVRTPGGSQREVSRCSPGQFVGEMALLTEEGRNASLTAVGDVRLLAIDRRHFQSIVRERPNIGLSVIRVLCDRLREAEAGAEPRPATPAAAGQEGA